MKCIVFTLDDCGVDGRAPPYHVFASFKEEERNHYHDTAPNRAWMTRGERIIDRDARHKQALAKLDAIDRLLLLGIPEVEGYTPEGTP